MSDDKMVLTVGPWVERDGPHSADSPYVERFWLPRLGPTATVLLRRLALDLRQVPEVTYSLPILAQELGVPGGFKGSGVNAPLVRSLRRLEQFGLLHVLAPTRAEVALLLPSLSPGHLAHLPEPLRQAHLGLVA